MNFLKIVRHPVHVTVVCSLFHAESEIHKSKTMGSTTDILPGPCHISLRGSTVIETVSVFDERVCKFMYCKVEMKTAHKFTHNTVQYNNYKESRIESPNEETRSISSGE